MTHRINAIGFRAHRALCRTGGVAWPVLKCSAGSYLRADGDVIWVGARAASMHPRTVMVSAPLPSDTRPQRFDLTHSRPWQPRPDPSSGSRAAAIEAVRAILADEIRTMGPSRGVGKLLFGEVPAFPLDLGVVRFERLAHAYGRHDPAEVLAASRALLGFGLGLTPSGDDFVGAALFGWRIAFPEAFADANQPGSRVAALLIDMSRASSHDIGAALFADLAEGASFAPLHQLAYAFAMQGDALQRRRHVRTALRELVAIGGSSGWDMLAGLSAGMIGSLSISDQPKDHDNG